MDDEHCSPEPEQSKLEGIEQRIAALERYEKWRLPVTINFADVVGPELWEEHWRNWSAVKELMKVSQKHAELLRARVADHVTTRRDPATRSPSLPLHGD